MVYFSSLLFHERLWPASTEEKERFWGILSRFYDLVGWKEMRFCKIVRFNPRNRRLNISFWKFRKLFIIKKELKLVSDYGWIMDHNAPGLKYWNQQGGQHMIAISRNLKGESHNETLMQKNDGCSLLPFLAKWIMWSTNRLVLVLLTLPAATMG